MSLESKARNEIKTVDVDYLFRIAAPDGSGNFLVGIAGGGSFCHILSPLSEEQISAYRATGRAYRPNGARIMPLDLKSDNVFDADPALTVDTLEGTKNLARLVAEIHERRSELNLEGQKWLGSRLMAFLRQSNQREWSAVSQLTNYVRSCLLENAVTTGKIPQSYLIARGGPA